MDEIETAELPELKEEIRRDKLNTLVAITVTLLVTFMAICKIKDNNIVLYMEQAQAARVDGWAWFQSLNIREDIALSRLSDLRDDIKEEENAGRKSTLSEKITQYETLSGKIAGKKETVKARAEAEEKRYESLNETHEHFDYCEGAISIAVSLLAMTTLMHRRVMYFLGLVPSFMGIIWGIWGLLG